MSTYEENVIMLIIFICFMIYKFHENAKNQKSLNIQKNKEIMERIMEERKHVYDKNDEN